MVKFFSQARSLFDELRVLLNDSLLTSKRQKVQQA